MKKCIAILLLMAVAFPLAGCANVPEHQRAAYENCLEYIKNSSFSRKDFIDTGIVRIETLKEEQKDAVWIEVNGVEEYFGREQPEHWLFTIGDTSGHNFAMLVCNSETDSVIGYIPIA